MRHGKGIKILLAICPSNHRSEDLLPPTRVSWNLRLSHVNFLSSLFLMSLFPAQWASCHFHCAGFSLCSASTVGALTKLGFCCVQPLPRGSRAEVVSAKLNPETAQYMSGEFTISSVLSCCSKNLKRWWTSVTAQFHLTSKGSYILEVRGLATKNTQREEKPPAQFWLLFLYASSPPPEPALCKLDSQKGCSLRFSLLSLDLPLFCFCGLLLSLSFSHHHYGLLFPILTT